MFESASLFMFSQVLLNICLQLEAAPTIQSTHILIRTTSVCSLGISLVVLLQHLGLAIVIPLEK